MKIIKHFFFLPLFILPTFLFSQDTTIPDSTGLPGDHFSLEGALELFKKAKSPEEFEKLLNQEENSVNNLDLNEDGEIDYIRVEDHMDGDVHAIVLQVPVSKSESQDVAVIEIEKTGEKEAMLQILGDEVLYGKEIIVEPYELDSKDDGRGPSVSVVRLRVNVYVWPGVAFIYGPRYRVYRSPFYWGVYPGWWRPWRPRPFRVFYPRTVVYRPRYHVVTTHRVVKAHKVYTPRRKTSTVVHTRTVSRRTVTGKKAGVKKTTKSTTIEGKGGRSITRETTTKSRGAQGRNGGAVGAKKTTTSTTIEGKGGRSVTHDKTTKAVGAKGRNGNAVGAKKSNSTTKAQGRNGGTVTRKKNSTAVGKKGKKGSAGAKRTTTRVKKKRGG